jgi:hypothetical protein
VTGVLKAIWEEVFSQAFKLYERCKRVEVGRDYIE